MDWVDHCFRELVSALIGQSRQVLTFAAFFLIDNWKYLISVVVFLALALTFKGYRRWKRGWLSGLVDEKIREMQRRKRWRWIEPARLLTFRRVSWWCRSVFFRAIDAAERYIRRVPSQIIKEIYLPSFSSFLAVSLILLLVFVVPHFTELTNELPSLLWHNILANFPTENSLRKVFEGLIVVTVALIVFVAKSIRDSENPERKRVLLRNGFLWPLTLAVTLFPLGYLAGQLTYLTVILVLLMSIWAIYAFSNVVQILLKPELQEEGRRTLLKERTRTLVLDSARERVGHNILLQKLGPNGNVKIQYTVSKSWMQGGSDAYILVELPQAGWIADVNIRELELLSKLIEDGARKLGFDLYERAAVAPGVATSNPELRSSPRKVAAIVKKAYLLKRFREQLPPKSIFSADGRAILALPKEFAKDFSAC